MIELITREEALARGLKRYFTGEACRAGHVTERYSYNGVCVECHRKRARRWSRANPERVRAVARRWYKANPEKQKEANRRWRQANPEKVAEYERLQRAADKARNFVSSWRESTPKQAAE